MTPTVQLPCPIAPGVWARTAKQRPSSRVLPCWPRSIRNTSPTSHEPLVGRAVRPDVGQGHTDSQLHASKYSPLTRHAVFAMTILRRQHRAACPPSRILPLTLYRYIECPPARNAPARVGRIATAMP